MPKRRRPVFADALAHLMFRKPLDQLDRYERAELDVIRAMEADAADRDREEQLAREFPEERGDHTLH
jgi:hypothetical protein